jgi:phosphoribosylformylglycinamidine synthase
VRHTLTPQLRTDKGDTQLLLIDLGEGQNRLGATALAQVYRAIGEQGADLVSSTALKAFFDAIQSLNADGKLMAYHDRSDGGLWATLCEMAFAGRCGLDIHLPEGDAIAQLFNEELGAVIQVASSDVGTVKTVFAEVNLADHVHTIAAINGDQTIRVTQADKNLLEQSRTHYQQVWSEVTREMQALRDNPDCAAEEFARIAADDPGLSAKLSFDQNEDIAAPYINSAKPRMAILREQGVNGQVEMAASFDKAGFEAVDVHMSDILSGRVKLDDFRGLVACGGFSYGDVLGAGEGWAKSILFNDLARDQFEGFFNREDSFSLGICNGCQMLSNLKSLIPGTEHWPHFVRNRSEQFEARFVMVEVQESSSVLLDGMAGSRVPIAVAHGEGRAEFASADAISAASSEVAIRYIENNGEIASRYPANPNGSPEGIAGLSNADGRVTIMMPHPERVIRTVTNSWHPDDWQESAPWMRLFRNARRWVN